MSIKSKSTKIRKAALGDNLGMTDYSQKFSDNIKARELVSRKEQQEGYGFNLGEQAGNLTQDEIYNIWNAYESGEDFNKLSNKVKDARRKAFTGYLNNFKNSTIIGTPGLNAMESFKTDNQYYADLQEQAKTDKHKKAEYNNLLSVIRVLGGYNAAGIALKKKNTAKPEAQASTETNPKSVYKGISPEQIADFKAKNIASQIYKFNPESLESDLNLFYSNRFGKNLDGTTFSNPTSTSGYAKQIGDYLQQRALDVMGDYSGGYSSAELAAVTKAKMAYDEALASGDPNKINIALINYGKSLGENERDIRLGISTSEDELKNLLFKSSQAQPNTQSNTQSNTSVNTEGQSSTQQPSQKQDTPVQGSALSEWQNYSGPRLQLNGRALTMKELQDALNSETLDDNTKSLYQSFINENQGREYEKFYEALAGTKKPVKDVNQGLYPGVYSMEGFSNAKNQQIYDISDSVDLPENEQIAMVRDNDDNYKFILFKDGVSTDTVLTPAEFLKSYKLKQDANSKYEFKALKSKNVGKKALGGDIGFTAIPKFSDGGSIDDYRNRKVEKEVRQLSASDIGTALGSSDYSLSAEDYLDLTALGADLLSAMTAGKSLWGSTAAGMAGTAANAAAQYKRGASTSDILKTAGIGLGLDLISAVPVLGQFAGTSKLVKTIAKVQKPLLLVLGASGLAVSGADTIDKLASGRFSDLNANDLKVIFTGLKAFKKNKTANKMNDMLEDAPTTTYRDKSGKEIVLTRDNITELNSLGGKERLDKLNALNKNNASLTEAGIRPSTITKVPWVGHRFGRLKPKTVFKATTPAELDQAREYADKIYSYPFGSRPSWYDKLIRSADDMTYTPPTTPSVPTAKLGTTLGGYSTLSNPFSIGRKDPYSLDFDTSYLQNGDDEIENLKNSANLEMSLKGQTPLFQTKKGIGGLYSSNNWSEGVTSPDDTKKGTLSNILPMLTPGLARMAQYMHSQKGTDLLKKYTKVDTPHIEATKIGLRPVSEDIQAKQAAQNRIAQLRGIRSNSGDLNASLATRLSAESQANQVDANYNAMRSQRLAAIKDKNLEIERLNRAAADRANSQNSMYAADAANKERMAIGILENRKHQNTERLLNSVAMRAQKLQNLYKAKAALNLDYDKAAYYKYISVLSNPNSTEAEKMSAQNALDALKRDYDNKMLSIKGI